MSGFVTLINIDGRPVVEHLLQELNESLYFQGPDGQNIWMDGHVGMGHTLLASTDNAQLLPASLDKEYYITGCIRIDGRQELLSKLEMPRGTSTEMPTDAELVLLSYRKWGIDCLTHLIGDFAFVLWDTRSQRLFCARDRFGMRQLYYARAGNSLVLSNSLQTMRMYPGISDRLNDLAVADFLLWSDHLFIDKRHTLFADIHSVLPGHQLQLRAGETSSAPYWCFPASEPTLLYRDQHEHVEHFTEIFESATRDRVRNKSTVISLSGGMDSSSIAATVRMLQQRGDCDTELVAATVLYDSIHPSDERRYLDLVAAMLDLHPDIMDGGEYRFLDPYKLTTRPMHLYQPQLWLDFQARAAARSPVILTGAAADNLFSTRESILETMRYQSPLHVLTAAIELKRRYGRFPNLGTGLGQRRKRLMKRSKTQDPFEHYPQWLNADFEKEFNLKERWLEGGRANSFMGSGESLQLADSMLVPDWNTDDYFMAPGCTLPEYRDPFLDTRLIEMVASSPALPWSVNKHVMRQAMKGKLPPEVVERPKTGLGNIHASLLNANTALELNEQKLDAQWACYIDWSQFNTFQAKVNRSSDPYPILGPFILNKWLTGMRVDRKT